MDEKIALAHPDLVVPVYLVEIQEETSVEEIVEYAFNSKFFQSTVSVIELSNESQNVANTTSKMQKILKKELEEEIDGRQQQKLKKM